MEYLTPTDFAHRSASEPWQLLDVRESWEREIASIAEADWIPMAEVDARSAELDKSRPTAVVCHSGVRSERVANMLEGKGFDRVANIVGGIDAWSMELDNTVPRY